MKSLTAAEVDLGFIGIGAMGSRIVRRLRDHEYRVTAYNRDRSKAEALVPYGVSVAESLAELAKNVDVIMSCLTDDDAVRAVYLGPDGILANSGTDKIVLEMSTISPNTSRELHDEAEKRGVSFTDVAISGSTPAVEEGTVRLLIGGDSDVFQAAEPIFQALTADYYLMGAPGAGTSMKLVVNAILGIGIQAIAEAMALGEAEGLQRKRLLYVLSQTAVVPPAHLGKLIRVEEDDYSPQFGVGLMNKDFRLILDAAASTNLTLPATEAAFGVNSSAFEEDPNADMSSVIRHMERVVDATQVREAQAATK